MAPMPRLELTLFGGFHARVKGGSAIDIATRKTRALLAYLADLERTATFYASDLLEGLGVRDSAFEEWLLIERQRLRNRAIAVLNRLLEVQTGHAGIATAERLISLDPFQEEGHRALMRLNAEAGELGLALRQYETAVRDLPRCPTT
jgi:DNA-binding SARP family transcriptional activator